MLKPNTPVDTPAAVTTEAEGVLSYLADVAERATRGIRLAHRARLKKTRSGNFATDPQKANLAIDTPKPCSCWMCGNPRKHSKEQTVQERSAKGLFRSLGIDD